LFIAGLLVGCPLPVALPRGNRKAVRERLVGVEVARFGSDERSPAPE
jgi:hypothetical protein